MLAVSWSATMSLFTDNDTKHKEIHKQYYSTYSRIEFHKWRGGAVVEVWLQPSSLYITVSDGRTCKEEKEEVLQISTSF